MNITADSVHDLCMLKFPHRLSITKLQITHAYPHIWGWTFFFCKQESRYDIVVNTASLRL